jgi:hypothetical protein
MEINVKTFVDQALTWLDRFVLVAFVVLIAIALLRMLTFEVTWINTDHEKLAYLAGAYWLARKAGK